MTETLTLVAGATGAVGLKACEAIVRDGGRVRALVRPTADAARRARLEALGAELVEGDLEQPETLTAAVEGVAAVITTASMFPRDPRPDAIERIELVGSSNLVDAAATAGVGRFVYTSFRATEPDFPFQQAKRTVESRLAGSGLEYSVLRPGNFMEVWFSPMLGFDVAGGTVQVYGEGTAPNTWMSSDDVAELAVWALHAELARNATLDMGGPEALSHLEVIEIYEELSGKPLERVFVPASELEQRYAAATAPTEKSLAGVMLGVAHGDVTDMREIVADSGIRLTGVRELAERQLASLP